MRIFLFRPVIRVSSNTPFERTFVLNILPDVGSVLVGGLGSCHIGERSMVI